MHPRLSNEGSSVHAVRHGLGFPDVHDGAPPTSGSGSLGARRIRRELPYASGVPGCWRDPSPEARPAPPGARNGSYKHRLGRTMQVSVRNFDDCRHRRDDSGKSVGDRQRVALNPESAARRHERRGNPSAPRPRRRLAPSRGRWERRSCGRSRRPCVAGLAGSDRGARPTSGNNCAPTQRRRRRRAYFGPIPGRGERPVPQRRLA